LSRIVNLNNVIYWLINLLDLIK